MNATQMIYILNSLVEIEAFFKSNWKELHNAGIDPGLLGRLEAKACVAAIYAKEPFTNTKITIEGLENVSL